MIQAHLPTIKGLRLMRREWRKGLSIRQHNPRAVAIHVAHAETEDIAGLTAQLATLFQQQGYDTKYPVTDGPEGGVVLVALKMAPKVAEASIYAKRLTSGEQGTPAAEVVKLLKPEDRITIDGRDVEIISVRSQQRQVPLFHDLDPQAPNRMKPRQVVSVAAYLLPLSLQRTRFTFYGPQPTYEGADYTEADATPPLPQTPALQQATQALIDAIVTATERAAREIARAKEASFEARQQPEFRVALATVIAETLAESWRRWTETPERARANALRAPTAGRGLLDGDDVPFHAVRFEPRYGGFGPRSLAAHFAKLPASPWHKQNVALERAALAALPAAPAEAVTEDLLWDRVAPGPLTVVMYLIGPDKGRGREITAALSKSPDVRATVRDEARGLLDVQFDTAKFATGWDLRAKEFLGTRLRQRLHDAGITLDSRHPLTRPSPSRPKVATEATRSGGVSGFRLGHVGLVARPLALPFPHLRKRRRVSSRV